MFLFVCVLQPGWFGNSSAFEVMLNSSAVDEEDRNRILPSDDLPSLFTRQVYVKNNNLRSQSHGSY